MDKLHHISYHLRMKYSTTLRVRTEPDLPPAIAAAAERRRMKAGEWLRQTIRRAVEAEGVSLPPGGDEGSPSTFPPATGMRVAA